MGQSHSTSAPREIPIEQLSHELALRFATKCYTHLEITHFKDNFKTLADHQDDIEYWKEDTLCRFLSLPDDIRAGPVIYQMCTYIGAFPFPSLAPTILTREAMLKVVTLFTGRYKKVLKRGNRDKAKLIYRSLAVFDRRASMASPTLEKPSMQDLVQDQKPYDMVEEEAVMKDLQSHVSGFAIDEPANDDEEEDEDDLALAALDSLDAIEVFKHDQATTIDRKINHALIPVDNFKRLIMLLLLLGNLQPESTISSYGDGLTEAKIRSLEEAASSIVAAFDPDPINNGIRYNNFVKIVSTSLTDLFEPLNALFEHFLFSRNINLSKHKDHPSFPVVVETAKHTPIYRSPEDTSSTILTDAVLAQIATSIHLISPTSTSTNSNIYASKARFNQLYSTTSHGTSLSSFSRQVTSWQSSSLLLISGTIDTSATTTTSSADSTSTLQPILLGAYLPTAWTSKDSSSQTTDVLKHTTFFLLQPRHAIFRANPYHRTPLLHFSTRTGIALGCVIPTRDQISRTNAASSQPILGPVSLIIDEDLTGGVFQHDGNQGTGAFGTDPGLEIAQKNHAERSSDAGGGSGGGGGYVLPKKVEFEVDSLEVWGISFPSAGSDGEDDEITRQKKQLAWEEAEAARRRGVNFGGDKDGARALLEMAGLVGDKSGNRSGGSV